MKSPTTGHIFPICTGTLISSNVFLTASHCTIYFDQELAPRGYTAYVSFDKSIPFGDLTSSKTKLIAATSVTNPAYNQTQSDSADIGALVLATSSKLPTALHTNQQLAKVLASGATVSTPPPSVRRRSTR